MMKYNRSYFDEFFTKAVVDYKLQRKALSIIILDIDDFKKINDTYGHVKGLYVAKNNGKNRTIAL